jgi:hypothetical protein
VGREIFNLDTPRLAFYLDASWSHGGFLMASTTGSPSGGAPGAIRTRNKNAASIAKRACDQCKFRKIKVFRPLSNP